MAMLLLCLKKPVTSYNSFVVGVFFPCTVHITCIWRHFAHLRSFQSDQTVCFLRFLKLLFLSYGTCTAWQCVCLNAEYVCVFSALKPCLINLQKSKLKDPTYATVTSCRMMMMMMSMKSDPLCSSAEPHYKTSMTSLLDVVRCNRGQTCNPHR